MAAPSYLRIVRHIESCLERHGDTPQGVDWPRPEDVDTRYAVMLDVIRSDHPGPVTLLDFGCGAGHLYEYLARRRVGHVRYTGLDLSEKFVALCRSKHPEVEFHCADILAGGVPEGLPRFDYVVANGVFTEKRELPFEEMRAYFEALVPRLFAMAGVGIAFNVMSKHVDWERDDLFHLPLDVLAGFLTRHVTRHHVIRNDYGLYEYTVHAYREPRRWPGPSDPG
jgi:SAM-dependent methyltransferase